jgi:hypothetical protein
MDKQFITTSENPTVTVDVQGNLRLKGHDELQVVAKGSSEEELTLEERDGQIFVTATSDCSLRVPRSANVFIKIVHGEAVIKGLDGVVSGDIVHGNLTLRDLGETSINAVYGEVSAKNIAGSLCFDRVEGNLQVKDVQEVFTITDRVNGNLRLDDVDMGATAKVDGNITLKLDPGPGEKFEFTAGGNIFCRLPEDASVEISVPRAAQVMVNLPNARSTAPIKTPYSISLGEAEANLILSAGGNVVLDRHAPDWGEFADFDVEINNEMEGMSEAIAQQVEAQMEAQMAAMEAQLESQMAGLEMRIGSFGLSEEQQRRTEERVRAASARAQERAQERMQQAQQRLEHKLADAQRKIELKTRDAQRKIERAAERGARRGRPPLQFTIPTVPHVGHPGHPGRPGRPGPSAPPSGEPVSEQERLMILRMLEQNKISLDQAEKLLAALEGKEG